MRVLFLSLFGDGLDIALRMGLEGNEVRCWVKDPKSSDAYDGLVKKVPAWQPQSQWADLIVIDNNKMPDIWRQVHKFKPTFGGNDWGYKLEQDRPFGHEVMKKMGLQRIESLSFKRVEQVIAHLQSHRVKHVIKPMGNKVESHHVIVSDYESGEDAIALLERFKGLGIPYDGIEVEERKEGIEVGVAGFFNGSKWVGPIEVNFEHKRMCDGEVGPLTGEAGTLMVEQSQNNPLFKKTLDRMTPILQEADYRGQIDLNMIVDKDGTAWPLEFTARVGYPAVFINSELQITPWSQIFHGIAIGKDFDFQAHHDWGVGVVLFSFGFPHEKEYMAKSHELPILGVKNLDHIHLMQAKQSRRGGLVTSSGEGYTLVSTGRGDTISEAKSRAYEHLSPVRVPNSFHRKDISDKISSRSQEILDLGIIEKDGPQP